MSKKNPLHVVVTEHETPHTAWTVEAADLLDELGLAQLTPGRMQRCHELAGKLREAARYFEGLMLREAKRR